MDGTLDVFNVLEELTHGDRTEGSPRLGSRPSPHLARFFMRRFGMVSMILFDQAGQPLDIRRRQLRTLRGEQRPHIQLRGLTHKRHRGRLDLSHPDALMGEHHRRQERHRDLTSGEKIA